RFEGFGHISHSSIKTFPRLHVSLPVISVLILSHAASVEDVDQAQRIHSHSVPGRNILNKVPVVAKEVSLRNFRRDSYVDILT
ncbi:MAG: hypothetical protein WBE81_31020, partial [Pseudolabrys sp.]